MSYLHLDRIRTRERTPEYDTYYSRPLVRRDSNKRQRIVTFSNDEDDCRDDYPYPSSHKPAKPSCALTIRNKQSQLERYNIWSDRRDKISDDDDEERREYEKRRMYKYTPYHQPDDEDKTDPEEREFRLQVKAAFSKHEPEDRARFWPADLFRSREKWSGEAWETRERSASRERRHRNSFWGDDEEKSEEKESWSRYRRMKKTKTEEFRPLSGWRRERIVYGL